MDKRITIKKMKGLSLRMWLADREEANEQTTTPLHCTHVVQRCWLTSKLTERKFPCWGILSGATKKILSIECRHCDGLTKHLGEQRRCVNMHREIHSEKEKVNRLALLPSLLIWQVSAMRKEWVWGFGALSESLVFSFSIQWCNTDFYEKQ